ncbi:WD40 repeat-like protein [Trichoderma novae-zelandiae]
MGAGRFFCVALPLLLTIGSIGTLLYAVLAGVAHENLKLIQVDLSELSVSPLTFKSLVSRAELNVKEIQTDNITAEALGLHKYYDVTLWGSCSSDDKKKWECSKGQFDWASKQINADDIKEGSTTIQLPKDVKDALKAFQKLIKWSEVAFIVALVGLGLELLIGIFSNFSRAVSCLTWFESAVTTILVIIACSLSTATVAIIAGVVQGSKTLYGAKVHLDGRFLAVIWIGAAFCIGASLWDTGWHSLYQVVGSWNTQDGGNNLYLDIDLTRDLSHVPITALALSRSRSGRLLVFAGEDSDLVVYEAKAGLPKGRLLSRTSVFVDQPIHGIHVRHGRVLVWGYCHVAVLSVERLAKQRDDGGVDGGDGEERTVMARAMAPDWIHHGAFSESDGYVGVLATAHNEVIPLRYSSDTGDIHLGAAIAPSRPMLYSAHLTWISNDTVLVAGGTVFGHVVVWKCRLSADNSKGISTETLFNFEGHEGSIFGVDIRTVTLSDGSSARILASCSDDRTVRIWDITERGEEDGTRSRASQTPQVIDTGFGGNDFNSTDNTQESSRQNAPIAAAMGHASRIWGVKFGPSCGGDALTVYSFGEDATTQRWRLQLSQAAASAGEADGGSRHLAGKLSHSKTFSLHSGKHLWSRAMLLEDKAAFVATGGADSQICLIEESNILNERPNSLGNLLTLDTDDILRCLLDTGISNTSAKEIISRYDFLSYDHILVTTSQGRLLLGHLKEPHLQPEWEQIDVAEDLRGDVKLCYIVKAIAPTAALLGTTSGNIYHFDLSSRKTIHVASVPGKIIEIGCLSKRDGLAEVLVYLHGRAESHYFAIDVSKGNVHSQGQTKGLDPRFVPTAAGKLNDLLVIGSRHGFLSILDRQQDGAYHSILDIATRSRDTITAILPLPPKSGSPQASRYILVTSRDGKYRIYELDRQPGSILLHLRHETSPPFGPVIAGAWFTQDIVPELVLYGFRSKDFVIWNETRREELATIECGGAHRTFQLTYSETIPGRYHFAFTKTSKLSISSSDHLAHEWVKAGVHGREIRSLSSNGRYIATGAEDTTIRIWEYLRVADGAQAEMRCVAAMKAHITGLQKLVWLGDNYLFSSAGNEEFFVWKVQSLESDYTGLAVMCEGVFTDKSADADLRIMDFDVCRGDDGSSIVVTMGFSNSVLRTYRYTSDDGRFQLLAKGRYTGACLTQTRHLSMRDQLPRLLTASTDGHLALWRTEPQEGTLREYVLEQAVPLHQNSIKSLDMIKSGEGYQVFTGGDDNSVGVTWLGGTSGSTDGASWAFSRRNIVRKAHAAAIAGVLLIRRRTGVVGISVSNDQRVKLWSIPSGEDGNVELIRGGCIGVADAGDIAAVGDLDSGAATIVIAGVGLEAWSLK